MRWPYFNNNSSKGVWSANHCSIVFDIISVLLMNCLSKELSFLIDKNDMHCLERYDITTLGRIR